MESLAFATPPVEIETGSTPTASVIWLHGLGADGHDFEPLVPELDLTIPTRFVFPHAPARAVTVNAGFVMRAWYDILPAESGFLENEQHVRESEEILRVFINRERGRGVPAARIVLAGFSQGGAIALHTGLRYPERLAGILVLSAYLPLSQSLTAECAPANQDVPIFMAHGELDPLIPLPRALKSRQQLVSQGYPIDWHTYPVAHTVSFDEVKDIGRWFTRLLEPRAPAAR
ncbi:MAG: alpha/beta hydrolase [Acidiferrobacterales bacterium]